MMLFRSPFRWLIGVGIMLFVLGVFTNIFSGREGVLHMVVGIPAHQIKNIHPVNQDQPSTTFLGYTAVLDSLRIHPFNPAFELQVREIDPDFPQEIHTTILPPSRLIAAFSPVPMKIRKIGNTEYRFRLRQFYPDFGFQYLYPDNQDTIPPKAPGITLGIATPGVEEVVTLRSDLADQQKLNDVVNLGCVLEFYWELPSDSVLALLPDSSNCRIVMAGKDKKIFSFFGEKRDTQALVTNRFYSIPGKDSAGYTVLQCFPDEHYLKAEPVSKSDQMNNPVAQVEVWKLGGLSQQVYLYPNSANRHGGDWQVPESNAVLTFADAHDMVLKACEYQVSILDSAKQVIAAKKLRGSQGFIYGKKYLKLKECDSNGNWADFRVWNSTGYYVKITGLLLVLAGFLGFLIQKLAISPRTPGKRGQKNEENQRIF